MAKAGVLIAEIEATIVRQSRGCFHPAEAAHLIAEAQDVDSGPLLNRMEEAFKMGQLIIREPGTELQRNPSEKWSRASDLVLASDIDDWLSRQGASYRFPRVETIQARSATPTDNAISPQLFQIMFERLERTSSDFRGGRLADIDVLELPEAALMASRHSKAEVTVKDILRAGARGEIPLKAVVHHRAKVYKDDGGICINHGHPTNENVVPAGAIPTLPLVACQHLANAGKASWRTFDGIEFVDGERWRFTKYQLTPDTPDFETTVVDCRISGYDLHALADAFYEDEAGNQSREQSEVETLRPEDRRISWYEASISYISDQLRKHHFANAKELYNALIEDAGSEDSPFDKGTDRHRGKLIVRAISKPVTLKTVQNRWSDIRQHSRSA